MSNFIKGVKRPKLDLSRVGKIGRIKKGQKTGINRHRGPDGDELTLGERRAISEYMKTGKKTAAVMAAYPNMSKATAADKSATVWQRPVVKKELQRVLEEAGLTTSALARKLRESLDVGWGEKATHRDALRGMEMALKVSGMMSDKSAHLRINVQAKAREMPYDDLIKEYNSIKQETESLTQEGEIVPPA